MNLYEMWEKFLHSGKVNDYLEFVKEEKKETENDNS